MAPNGITWFGVSCQLERRGERIGMLVIQQRRVAACQNINGFDNPHLHDYNVFGPCPLMAIRFP